MQFPPRSWRPWRLCRSFAVFTFSLLISLLVWETGVKIIISFSNRNDKWFLDQHAGCPDPSTRRPPTPDTSGRLSLSPGELLCWPLNGDLGSIPKLLHQSWKSAELPVKFQVWSDTCREKNKDWAWVLWSDKDNLELVRRYFPWLEDDYHALPGDIYRVDLMRNMYMYIFGGVYADLDTECLRPLSALSQKYRKPLPHNANDVDSGDHRHITQIALFGRMGANDTFEHSIPNAWMAASPGHPFFLMPLLSARAEMAKSRRPFHKLWYDFPSAEQMTGPIALRKQVNQYQSRGLSLAVKKLAAQGPFGGYAGGTKPDLVLLPHQMVYPFNWNEEDALRSICSVEQHTFNARQCKEVLKVDQSGSVSITYWSHTHRGKGVDEKNLQIISQN